MKAHILVQVGIYLSEVWGVFSSEEKAREAFIEKYEKAEPKFYGDFDGYHDYYIVQTDIDDCHKVCCDLRGYAVRIDYIPKREGK